MWAIFAVVAARVHDYMSCNDSCLAVGVKVNLQDLYFKGPILLPSVDLYFLFRLNFCGAASGWLISNKTKQNKQNPPNKTVAPFDCARLEVDK